MKCPLLVKLMRKPRWIWEIIILEEPWCLKAPDKSGTKAFFCYSSGFRFISWAFLIWIQDRAKEQFHFTEKNLRYEHEMHLANLARMARVTSCKLEHENARHIDTWALIGAPKSLTLRSENQSLCSSEEDLGFSKTLFFKTFAEDPKLIF